HSILSSLSFSISSPPPSSTPFPYTTLFRSVFTTEDAKAASSTLPTPPAAAPAEVKTEAKPGEPAATPPAATTPSAPEPAAEGVRSEEHTSELQSLTNLVCRLLLEKKNPTYT